MMPLTNRESLRLLSRVTSHRDPSRAADKKRGVLRGSADLTPFRPFRRLVLFTTPRWCSDPQKKRLLSNLEDHCHGLGPTTYEYAHSHILHVDIPLVRSFVLRTHQQPEVTYLPCFENDDLPCRLHEKHVVCSVNHQGK